MWFFQENFLNFVNRYPKNVLNETNSNGVFSKTMFASSESIALLNNIYFVFWRLKDNLFALIHNKLLVLYAPLFLTC